MKLLEEEFRGAFLAQESPYKVCNCVVKVFGSCRTVPEFPRLVLKGLFFGLKLYFADIEADEEVRLFFREKLTRRLRDIDPEVLLLVDEFFGLTDDKSSEAMVEIAARSQRDITTDPRPKRALKILLQFMSRYQSRYPLHTAVDSTELLKRAASLEMWDEAFAFARPQRSASVQLLALMVPSRNSRHMKQLIKAHQLDPEAFPQLFEFLRYGFYRYAIRELGPDLTEERAAPVPADVAALVRFLLQARLRDEAYSVWSRHRGLPELREFDGPFADQSGFRLVENKARARDDFLPASVVRDPSVLGEFLTLAQLGYEEDAVTMVGKAEFEAAREAIFAAPEVALDSESFVPDVSGFEEPRLALLQVATPQRVFLIDVLAIGPTFKLSFFVHQLLKAPSPAKLALGFDADLKAFEAFFRPGKPYELHNLVDVAKLAVQGESPGLASLVERCLLKRLCKLEQTSAWNARPLRRAQTHYAALDAAVLFRLHEVLRQRAALLFSPSKQAQAEPVALGPTPDLPELSGE